MATDIFAVAFLSPVWWIAVGACLAIGFGIWYAASGRRGQSLGLMPFVLATIAYFVALLAISFVESSIIFVGREQLARDQYWAIVPGWTLYLFSILGSLGTLVFMLTGVPVAALLVRYRRFGPISIAIVLLGLWLAPSLFFWSTPSNQWEVGHRLEALFRRLRELGPLVWIGYGSFLATLLIALRRKAL